MGPLGGRKKIKRRNEKLAASHKELGTCETENHVTGINKHRRNDSPPSLSLSLSSLHVEDRGFAYNI